MYVLGIEGSANKVGVGIVGEDGSILANPRRTCADGLLLARFTKHLSSIGACVQVHHAARPGLFTEGDSSPPPGIFVHAFI